MRSRHVRARIRHLKRVLKGIDAERETQARQRRRLPSIAVVGYTNVGKSTLVNALTNAHVYVDDRLFATLDATSRALQLPDGRKAILNDTVGFIRHLPHGLIASFRSTLSEVREADVILHVADATHHDTANQMKVVEDTLSEIGATEAPRILAFNKIDLVGDSDSLDAIQEAYPQALLISAVKRAGLDELLSNFGEAIPERAEAGAAH